MLVLSRKVGEKLVIGNEIWVTVVAVNGNRVRVGIAAPDDVPILRSELAGCLDEAVDGDQSAEPVSSEMSHSNGDDIVPLATACSRRGAHRRRQKLEDEVIRCQLVGENLGGFGIIPPGHQVPELWVYREYAERATAILNTFEKHRPH
jgi:carbon storage regulator